ncbi:MAG: glycosyltransferase, partial [Planctomycetes bacterium]|nr:glycosyltransferase [Planctomycetota bacterium]
GIPWICDFRDPWTDYFLGEWPTRLHYWLCRRMERDMMACPDAVIAITPGHQKIIERRWPELRGRVVTITNGFEDERPVQGRLPDRGRPTGRLDIVYSGSFCGSSDPQDRASLGQRLFSFRPRDFRAEGHTARYLLEAMASFLRRSPGWRGRLSLTQLGVPDQSAQCYATKLGIGEAFHSPGYVPAAESARLQAEASALFLCVAHSTSGDYNDCVPQKTYEYLATGRPILAAVPDGDARAFLHRAGNGLVCHTTDVRALADAIGKLCEMADGDRPEPAPDWQFIAQFRASHLTHRLVRVFHAVLGGSPTLNRIEPFPRQLEGSASAESGLATRVNAA